MDDPRVGALGCLGVVVLKNFLVLGVLNSSPLTAEPASPLTSTNGTFLDEAVRAVFFLTEDFRGVLNSSSLASLFMSNLAMVLPIFSMSSSILAGMPRLGLNFGGFLLVWTSDEGVLASTYKRDRIGDGSQVSMSFSLTVRKK